MRLIGIEQPDVSNLLRDWIRGYSIIRLLKFLTALNRDVVITIKPATKSKRKRAGGKITIKVL